MMVLGAGLCGKHICMSQRLDDLVLVGFSVRSGSPDIGKRESAAGLGARRRLGRPARRRSFVTHICRAILPVAVVARRVLWRTWAEIASLRVAVES